MELIVGTGSTWSLRVWICLKLVEVEATEVIIDLAAAEAQSLLSQHSPSGLVPVFVDGHIVIHDSLAIIEHINEQSQGKLYPSSVKERATARSLCAELHAGFTHLRQECPFTLQPVLERVLLSKGAEQEIARIETIFESAKLPYMFEFVGAIDAFYAILAFRLNSYGIHLKGKAGEYQRRLLEWNVLTQAILQADKWEKNGQ